MDHKCHLINWWDINIYNRVVDSLNWALGSKFTPQLRARINYLIFLQVSAADRETAHTTFSQQFSISQKHLTYIQMILLHLFQWCRLSHRANHNLLSQFSQMEHGPWIQGFGSLRRLPLNVECSPHTFICSPQGFLKARKFLLLTKIPQVVQSGVWSRYPHDMITISVLENNVYSRLQPLLCKSYEKLQTHHTETNDVPQGAKPYISRNQHNQLNNLIILFILTLLQC